jgi:hypothetical protein
VVHGMERPQFLAYKPRITMSFPSSPRLTLVLIFLASGRCTSPVPDCVDDGKCPTDPSSEY